MYIQYSMFQKGRLKFKKLIVIMIVLLSVKVHAQNKAIDSLRIVLSITKSDTVKCNILNGLIQEEINDDVWSNYNLLLFEIATSNLKKEKNQTLITTYKRHLATALCNSGVLQQDIGNNDSALSLYTKSLKIYEDIGFKQAIAETNINIGKIYYTKGMLSDALNHYRNSQIILEGINNKKSIAQVLYDISKVYGALNDLDKALEYLFKSLNLRDEIKDNQGIASSLNMIGYVYEKKGDYNKALDYYDRTLKLSRETKNTFKLGGVLNNLGKINRKLGKPEIALKQHEEALKYKLEVNDKSGMADSYSAIGDALMDLKRSNEAFKNALKAYEIATEIKEPNQILIATTLLSKLYKEKEDYKNAFKMFEIETTMKDSIGSKTNRQTLSRYQYEYEFQKKEIEMEAASRLQQQKAETDLKLNRTILYAVVFSFILLLVIIYFVFNNYKQKKQFSLSIETQKAEEEERKRIARDLHDDLGGTLSVLKINITSQNYTTETLSILDKAITDLRNISHKLMPLNFDEVGLNRSLKHYMEALNLSSVKFTYLFDGEDGRIRKEQQLIIYRIILELVSNVVKHSQAKTCTVQGVMFEEFIRIVVEDDGVGFDRYQKQTGIGLMNIKKRVEQQNGKIDFDINKHGTTVMLEIPIS